MSSNEESKGAMRGVLPAVVTPFDRHGEFIPATLERLLARLYETGVHGVYVCGQTGEGLLQTVEARQRVAEVAVRCSPRGSNVIVHVGAACMPDAIQLANHAARIGASAVSSLPPCGNYTFAEVRNYYDRLARATELPLLVYYFPEVSQTVASLNEILELCTIPNVVGLKFTDFDLFKLHQISRSGKVIFNGRDEAFAAGMLMGADGGIGTFYNLVPKLFLQIYQSALRHEWQEARRAQDQVNELIRITQRFPVFAAVKTMLKWQGFDCGRCLAPRQNLSAQQEVELRRLIEESSLSASVAGAR